MSAQLTEGTIFADRYRIVRCFAAGGMGAVYEVIHLETDRRRALKVMHPHLFQSDEMRGRFKREARIGAQVDSEYIVEVFDAGVDEATKTPFLVMELLRGEELGDRLKRLGRLPPGEVVTYLQQVGWALARTHAASIVHRDLKPQNLFLTQREDGSPRVKILDFGVAKLVAEGATAAGATQSLGTPLYMAPEQFRVDAPLTGAADIYALGMMAYTLLVGEPYWRREAKKAGDVIAFAMVAIFGPQESAVQRAASCGVALPPVFDAWFACVTAVHPGARFPTATDAIQALGNVLGISPGASPASVPVMMSGTGPPLSSVRAEMPSAGALERGPSAGAAMTPSPMVPGRQSSAPLVAVVAILVLLGFGVVGVGAWLVLRARSTNPSVTPQVTAVASTVRSTASMDSVPSVAPTSPEPSPAASVVASTSSGVRASVKATPKPTAAPKSSGKSADIPLLGR